MSILEKYREDPVLLDPHIVDLLKPVIGDFLLRSIHSPGWSSVSSLMCSFIYILSSICGYKTLLVSEVFPHDFSLLNKVLSKLEECIESWESHYVLFLWLSVLIQVPFELSTIGIDCARLHALSRFEKDANKSFLKVYNVFFGRFFSRDLSQCRGCSLGTLRKILLFTPPSLFGEELVIDLIRKHEEIVCKENFLLVAQLCCLLNCCKHLEIIEEQIDSMIANMTSKDGAVRNGVAKSLAILFGSLPRFYSSQVFSHIFNYNEDHPQILLALSLHTECLFLGQIVRNGKMDRISLPILLNKISKSLTFQSPDVPLSLSREIRDSGCALVWSLARSHMLNLPIVEIIVPSLVNLCLFDRDINLRRAGAAALQELVGRIGTTLYPFGLELIGEIDFWSVAHLEDTFIRIPKTFVQHLKTSMSFHLDEIVLNSQFTQIQILAAKGLANVGIINIEKYFNLVTSPDSTFSQRFGSIKLMEYFVHNLASDPGLSVSTSIRSLVPFVEKRRLFRGKGGDKIRIACYELLVSILKKKIVQQRLKTIKDRIELNLKFLQKVVEIVSDGIVHLLDSVQAAAINVWRLLATPSYYSYIEKVVEAYMLKLDLVDVNVCQRRGMVWALAVCRQHAPSSLEAILCREAIQWPEHFVSPDLVDPLTRKHALEGCTDLNTILICMEDFQTDNRGDVGSWIRLKALELAYNFLAISTPNDLMTEQVLDRLVAHCCERIDRVRLKALEYVYALSHQYLVLRPFLSDGAAYTPILSVMLRTKMLVEIILLYFVGSFSGESELAETSLLNLMESDDRQNVISSLLALLSKRTLLRFNNDRMTRLSVPLIRALTVISEYLSVEETELVIAFMAKSHPFSALKWFGKFIAKTLTVSGCEFLINRIFYSNIPTLRYMIAQDLMTYLNDDELIDLIDNTDWLSETDWTETVDVLARTWNVSIIVYPVEKSMHKKNRPYAEFVHEEYRN